MTYKGYKPSKLGQTDLVFGLWSKFISRFSGTTRICCEEGRRCKLYHGARTANFWAGCSSCSTINSFV